MERKITFKSWGVLFIVFLLFVSTNQSIALEQIQNGAFGNIAGWTPNTPIAQDDMSSNPSNFGIQGGSFQGRYEAPNMPGTNIRTGDGELYQTFNSTAKAYPVNVRVGMDYQEAREANDPDWNINFSAEIVQDSDHSVSFGNVLTRTNVNEASGFQNPFTSAPTFTGTLPAGNRYAILFTWVIRCAKKFWAEERIDNISVNISPGGLSATEEADGDCALSWPVSTGVTAATEYRIYRKFNLADSWTSGFPGPGYVTSGTNSYTDTDTAGHDVIYYAVSDYDGTSESPLSPYYEFRTAKFEITSVDVSEDAATVGQTVLVTVNIKNLGTESNATVTGVTLTYDPSTGAEFNPVINPATPLPTVPALSPGGTTSIEFFMEVETDCEPETFTIDANVSGTNDTLTVGAISTNGSLSPDDLLVRSPANLVVTSVTTPSSVYCAQEGVTIFVELLNDGAKNAAAIIDDIDLDFNGGTDDGDYFNITNITPLGAEIHAGFSKTFEITLDVSAGASSANNPIVVDVPKITFHDINLPLQALYNYDGATTPGQWNVKEGLMRTYKGPPLIESDSFNLSVVTIYAEVSNLQPSSQYRFRWYNDSDLEVRVTDPPIYTDSNGYASDEYTLTLGPPASEKGTWRVIATKVTNSTPLAEKEFSVVDPAGISCSLALPVTVTDGLTFVATMTITNTGEATVDGATPGTLSDSPPIVGAATQQSGPSPATINIPGGESRDFTWTYLATAQGVFRIEGDANGFDLNDFSPLTAATSISNDCLIQAPPVLSVVSVTAAPTHVSINQQGIPVDMVVRNTGQADAYIDSATLTIGTNGDYTQTVNSPIVSPNSPLNTPILLPGGQDVTITFWVGVEPTSSAGTDNLTGTYTAYDANDPGKTPLSIDTSGITGDQWDVLTVSGKCSANSSFSPEQYKFNMGQVIYTQFTGLTPGNKYAIFYDDDTVADSEQRVSDPTIAGADGKISDNFAFSTGNLGKWRAEIYEVNNGGNEQTADPLGIVFFDVQDPGVLSATLNMDPTEVELGDNFTITLSVENITANGSTISGVTPGAFSIVTGEAGDATLVSGPTPASLDISPATPGTFTWVYNSTDDTETGNFSMSASVTGTDENTIEAAIPTTVTSNTAVSNTIVIYRREVNVDTAVINLGQLICGETKTATFNVINDGNTVLNNLTWEKSYPTHTTTGDKVVYSAFNFTPPTPPASSFVLGLPKGSTQSVDFEITVPYNQPAAESGDYYTANMSVYEDLNLNNTRDLGEPSKTFEVRFEVLAQKVIVCLDKTVDLGGCPQGDNSEDKILTILNAGNIDLTNLTIAAKIPSTKTFSGATTEINVDPLTIAALPIGDEADITINATVDPLEPIGNDYEEEWEVTEGAAVDDFKVIFDVGDKVISPESPIDLGAGNPTQTVGPVNFLIENNGDLDLDNLKLKEGAILYFGMEEIPINDDTITLNLPANIPSGYVAPAADNAVISLYIPPGTLATPLPTDYYEGTVTLFDDVDGDGLPAGDGNEKEGDFTLRVRVNSYDAVEVLNTTVGVGGIIPGNNKVVTFTCKNIGNTDLTSLKFDPAAVLTNGDPTYDITSTANAFGSRYYFTALGAGPFVPGQEFLGELTVDVGPSLLQSGDYTGSFGWLYNDQILPAGRTLGEPEDKFKITCQIGGKSINVVEAGPLAISGDPATTSDSANFTAKNTGDLILTAVKMEVTNVADFTDGNGRIILVKFNPNPLDYILPTQNRIGTVYAEIPAGQANGVYSGTVRVFEDDNGSGAWDTGEIYDDIGLSVTVNATTSISVTPDPTDLGYVPATTPETSKSLNLTLQNTGNQDLIINQVVFSPVALAPISVGPPPIGIAQITYTPSPVNVALAAGDTTTVAVKVTVPSGQIGGTYQGTQVATVNPTGEKCYFVLKLTVAQKDFDVDTPVHVGPGNPGDVITKSFNMTNNTTILLSRLKWEKVKLVNAGGDEILPADFDLIPITDALTPFSCSAKGVKGCTASYTISAGKPAGTYTGVQYLYEDEDDNGSRDPDPNLETQAAFTLEIEISEYPHLTITNSPINISDTLVNETSAEFDVIILNDGNVDLSNLVFQANPLYEIGGDTIDPGIINMPTLPNSVTIGNSITGKVKIGPIPAAQTGGAYSGECSIYSTDYVAPEASGSFVLNINVLTSSGPDIASGTLYQEIATAAFSATVPERLIFSAWVNPGTGTAGLNFLEALPDGTKVTESGLKVDSTGTVTSFGAAINPMISEKAQINNSTWFKISFAFDYQFDISTASHTYILLQNFSNNDPDKNAVWFDGIQLEKAVYPDQEVPTSYAPKGKLISPSRSTTIGGEKSYYQW